MRWVGLAAAVVALASAGAARAGFNDFRGAWAASAEGCAAPAVTVSAATARSVRVTTTLSGRPSEKVTDFDAETKWLTVMFTGPDGEPRFVELQPKDGKLNVEYKRIGGPPQERFGSLALKAGGSAVLVRCPEAAPPPAAPAAPQDPYVAAMDALERSFGPSWLDGSWGAVNDKMEPVGLFTPFTCPSEAAGYYRATSAKPARSGKPWDIRDTGLKGQGLWTFYKGKDGRTYVSPDHGSPFPVETWDAGKPRAFGVTLPKYDDYGKERGGRKVVSLHDLAMKRTNEAGVWGPMFAGGAQPPVSAFLFVLKVSDPDSPRDPYYLVKCR